MSDGPSSRRGRLPDFIIIGAQKAGTTWLGNRLLEQPSVFLPRPLEVRFFDGPAYDRGLDWYSARFADAGPDSVLGEKTPDYFWTTRPEGMGPNDIPARIHNALPDVKLVVILRDPVRRAISALGHYIRSGWVSPFTKPDTALVKALDPAEDRYGLVSRGHYLAHLQRFLEYYPMDHIHVVFFEDDVIKKPQECVDNVSSFLGGSRNAPIQAPVRPENRRMNSRLGLILNYYAPILSPVISAIDRTLPAAPEIALSADCQQRLQEHYAPHNRALFEFLGRRASWANG